MAGYKGILHKLGIASSSGSENIEIDKTLKMTKVNADTGYDKAAFIQHGTRTTALVYGTQTSHLLLRSHNITAGATGVYVIGDHGIITTSALSTGYFTGSHYRVNVGHTVGAARAYYGEVNITATAVLNGNVRCFYADLYIAAGTITGAGKLNGVSVEVAVLAGTTVAQGISGIEVDMRGIKVDVAGETIGIKVTMAGGGNYLDYGMQFSNCFNTATAVLNFDLTQGNVACVILTESGAHTITKAFSFTGTITTLLHFGATGAGIVHGGAAAANVAGYIKVMVGTTAYRIPYLVDSDS